MTVTTSYARINVVESGTVGVVNSTITGDNDAPAASVGGNGNAFVVYNTSNNAGDISIDFLQSDGSHPSTTATVNTTTAGLQQNAQAVTLGDGSVLVVFEDLSSGTHTDLRARWFNADGTAREHTFNGAAGTDDFQLYGGSSNDITAFDVSETEVGGFMLAMGRAANGGTVEVSTFDSTLQFQSLTDNVTGTEIAEVVAASGETGGGQVAWIESGGDVKSRVLSGVGNSRFFSGTEKSLDTIGNNAGLALANGGGSNFLLAFTDDIGGGDTRVAVVENPNSGSSTANYVTVSGQNSSQASIVMLDDNVYGVTVTQPFNPNPVDLDIGFAIVDGRAFSTLDVFGYATFADSSNVEDESAIFAYGPGIVGTVFQQTGLDGDGSGVGGEIWEVQRTSTGDGDNDIITGDRLKDIINGNGGSDTLTGGGNDDTIDGGAGNDRFIATLDDGDDTYTGGDDEDTLDYSDTTKDVTANLGAGVIISDDFGFDTLTDQFENIFSGSFNDTLIGNDLDNLIDGGGGADTMHGEDGNDRYLVDNPGDTVVEASGKGTEDQVDASISYTLTDNVERLFLDYSAGAINGTGNAGDNILRGNSSNNELDGKAGADDMRAADGDDTYIVDDAGDTVFEFAGEGTDTVNTFVSFVLPEDVENLTLLADGNLGGTGNVLDNTLIGNSGNNTLDGAGGADNMLGGLGDDTYIVDDAGDSVSEGAGEGTDQVNSYVGFTLFSNLEHLSLLGSAHVNAIGNELDNNIFGNSGSNTLDGLTGADDMRGGDGNDIYVVDNVGDQVSDNAGPSGGTDQVNSYVGFTLFSFLENLSLLGSADIDGIGNELDNAIFGNSGNNTLDGLTGADDMRGGDGDDIYVVDNVGDQVSDNTGAAGGIDQVNSYVGFTLFDNLENLSLLGSADINGIGNALDNVLIGNSGNNTLDGLGGADTMVGLGGDDIYVVDNAGDTVSESPGGGTDQVNSFFTFILPSDVENLSLLGTGDINAVGNGESNILIGNSGNNILDGLAGNDTAFGGAGDDTYVITDLGDTANEAEDEGTDQVNSSRSFALPANIENLTLLGTARDAEGNDLNNVIIGNGVFNQIFGYGGDDTLAGGGGEDFFKFSPGSGHDTITDFEAGPSTTTEFIGIRDYNFANFNAVLAVTNDDGFGNTVITLSGSDSLTLLGVLKADLDVGDFLIS